MVGRQWWADSDAARLAPRAQSKDLSAAPRDMEAVRRRLGDTAAEVMGRLSAAAMESYPRAYPHLVRLHMLQVDPRPL